MSHLVQWLNVSAPPCRTKKVPEILEGCCPSENPQPRQTSSQTPSMRGSQSGQHFEELEFVLSQETDLIPFISSTGSSDPYCIVKVDNEAIIRSVVGTCVSSFYSHFPPPAPLLWAPNRFGDIPTPICQIACMRMVSPELDLSTVF